MKYDIRKICSNFMIHGEFDSGVPYGTGHINDTFLVTYNQAGVNVYYILQRINHYVFKDTRQLMDNISRVIEHISQELKSANICDISRKVLTLIECIDGNQYYVDCEGNTWRIYLYIANAKTYDVVNSIEYARKAAEAFGQFQYQLSSMNLYDNPLYETIPDFHNGPLRYEGFLDALHNDLHNRAIFAKNEIDFLNKNSQIFNVFPKLIETGDMPIRITHNDTKINNIMFDSITEDAVCVIDLDTVMPGISLYDFGDIVRTTVSQSDEDEKDLSKVVADISRFDAIISGYLAGARQFLTAIEKSYLVHSAIMMTLMIGTRFLTDYLAGDKYFKVTRDSHNLDRCRTQFKLVKSMLEQYENMQKCVDCYNY